MTGGQTVPAGTRVLFVAVALGTTGFVASLTVAPLVAEDLSRSTTLSGLPWTAGVLGTGLGSVLLAQLMARRGRGPGLVLGYASGAAGCGLAILAIAAGSFVLFVVAVMAMGIGNSASNLSRYAAADLYPPERRASGLGTVVWAGTIGGVAGPALLEPSGQFAIGRGLPKLAGPFAVAAVGSIVAVIALVSFIRVRPGGFRSYDVDAGDAPSGMRIRHMWRVPRAQAALYALAVAQTVMVLIMAMTPLHMRSMGHGLSSVGLVIGAHVFGMYGLSPVSGRLADRFGAIPMILAGFAVLTTASVGAAAAPVVHEGAGVWLAVPLFLLGWGWSLTFVSASVLLTEGLSYADRARLQGATDSVVWTAAAVAGLSSGVLVEAFGYALLCIVGALLIVGPVLTIAGRRRVLAMQPL